MTEECPFDFIIKKEIQDNPDIKFRVIKMVSGEDIVCLSCECRNDSDKVFLFFPQQINKIVNSNFLQNLYNKDQNDNENDNDSESFSTYISFEPWMEYSNKFSFNVNKTSILTDGPMKDDIKMMYRESVNKYLTEFLKDRDMTKTNKIQSQRLNEEYEEISKTRWLKNQ